MRVMRHSVAGIAVVVVGMTLGLGELRLHGQDALRSEVRAALDEYVRAFSAHDAAAIADRVVMAPSLLLGNDGVVTYGTTADVKSRYIATLGQLANDKYDRSVVKTASVCVLNNSAAVVTAQFVRYRTDGSTLSEPSATYVFAKAAGGWKITRGLSCAP
jgi:ketosteroid isomerase-like protein